MTIDLFRVILPVTDIEAAATFYGKVLDRSGKRVSPGRHYFRCGSTILACYCPLADGDPAGAWAMHENQYIYFAVQDLEALHQRVKAAGASRVDEKIATMPWGERLFYARDPFGNPICFVDERTKFTGESVG